MTAQQLPLFAPPIKPRVIDPVAGFEPTVIHPNDKSYLPFDGAQAKATILELCTASGHVWITSHQLFNALKMYPSDLSRLAWRMAEKGLIERTELYYGSSTPLEPDYKGFQHGYRLPQPTEAA